MIKCKEVTMPQNTQVFVFVTENVVTTSTDHTYFKTTWFHFDVHQSDQMATKFYGLYAWAFKSIKNHTLKTWGTMITEMKEDINV